MGREKIAVWLLMIYNLRWEELKSGNYLQVDETPVKVLDPKVKGKAAQGYLWFYSRPAGDVFLEFFKGRGRDGPEQRLRGFKGTIQNDAYYESLRRHSQGKLRRIGCLAHSRRKFYKALLESSTDALWFIGQIRTLYQIEDALKDATPEERRRGRLQKAPQIWLLMKRMQSCRRRGIHPQEYLTDVLQRLPSMATSQVSEILPSRWKPAPR